MMDDYNYNENDYAEMDYDSGLFLLAHGDYVLAHQAFWLAAMKGHINAMLCLAELYKRGKGVMLNAEQYYAWIKNAEILKHFLMITENKK